MRSGDNKIIINTNLRMGLPLENINKIAGPMLEAWAGEVFAGIRDDMNNPYHLIMSKHKNGWAWQILFCNSKEIAMY